MNGVSFINHVKIIKWKVHREKTIKPMTDSNWIRRYKRKRDIVEEFTDYLERVRQNPGNWKQKGISK